MTCKPYITIFFVNKFQVEVAKKERIPTRLVGQNSKLLLSIRYVFTVAKVGYISDMRKFLKFFSVVNGIVGQAEGTED